MYKLTKKNSSNKGYPDGAKGGNKPKKIIIHHWGVDGQKFDNVVGWLCNPKAGVSAHYVVEAGKVTKLMNDTDCAWHAGSKAQNTTSIGIECRPECTKADIETVIELIADLYAKHGVLPVVGHKDVAATSCPGRWYKLLGSIEEEATKLYKSKKKSKTYSGSFPRLPLRRYFKIGDKGKNVKKLQQFLNWAIDTNLVVDGELGTKTFNAVKAFQKKYELKVDGLFGKGSLAKAKNIKR